MLDKRQPESALATQPVGGGHSARCILAWVWVHVMVTGCFSQAQLGALMRGWALMEVGCSSPFRPDQHPSIPTLIPQTTLASLSLLISFIYIEMVLENTRYANTQTGGG